MILWFLSAVLEEVRAVILKQFDLTHSAIPLCILCTGSRSMKLGLKIKDFTRHSTPGCVDRT